MGMSAVTLGVAMGGLSAASSLLGGISQSGQMRMQAKAAEANAASLREQAKAQAQAGESEAQAIDMRKTQLRRQFDKMQGENRVQLGVGNVDLSSGSAEKVALGNIDMFAADIGENAYQRAVRRWESANQVKNTNWQADNQEAQANYYRSASNNWGSTLLNSAISGATGFMSGYSWGGGKLGDLFGKSAESGKFWDRALQDWSKTIPRH